MHRIRTIALNRVSDIFRRKVLYVGIAATIAFELPAIADFLFSRSMSAAQFLQNALLHQRAAVNAFTVWTTASIYLGIGLASVVLSWELQERTIFTVLARPVARAEFLVAKWLAVLLMTLVFLAIGVIIGLLCAWDLDVQILPMLKVALTATVVSIVCFTAVSMMLSVFLTPVVTSVVGIFMVMAPDLLRPLFRAPVGFDSRSGNRYLLRISRRHAREPDQRKFRQDRIESELHPLFSRDARKSPLRCFRVPSRLRRVLSPRNTSGILKAAADART